MHLLGITEMCMKRTWKVSAGEVKMGDMPPIPLDWHYFFRPHFLTQLMISLSMT